MAVVFAVLAELCAALSTVVQQRQASAAPERRAMNPSLLFHLLRNPTWLLGLSVMLAGYGCQAVALGIGRLVLVEPLLGTGVALAVPLGALWAGRRPSRGEMVAALAVGAGVAGFLLLGRPTDGRSVAPASQWLPWMVPVLAFGAVAAAGAGRVRASARAAVLAALAGFCFALTDGLTKSVIHLVGAHPGGLLTYWSVWALAGFGLLGFLTQQSAFHTAPLSVSLPPSALVEPLIGTLIGLTVLGEHLHASSAELGGELLAVVVAAAGVIYLARAPVPLSRDIDPARSKA